MNYIQYRYNLPQGIVFVEEKTYYYAVLSETREKEDLDIFQEIHVGTIQEDEKFAIILAKK
ncbi:MAG: hypothetical protein ACOCWM_02790 [Cyclobacteriaceae bacterium]